jgi:HSP20 family protein
MAKNKPPGGSGAKDLLGGEGFLGGLSTLVGKLVELAEKGQELQKSGEIRGLDPEGKVSGVYGFTIRTGLKGKEPGIKVEPFGNVRPDERTGQPVVHEVREPMVDVFEEPDHVLVVAELPGISAENVDLELRDDILVIVAAMGEKKYRKEVLLPAVFPAEKMSRSCRNGVLQVRFQK